MTQNVTSRQRKAIEALLFTPTITAASETVGVTRNTIYRWLRDPTFASELQRVQSDRFAQTTRAAVDAMTSAIDTLKNIAGDAKAPAGARVSASRAILECAARLTEIAALNERLSKLEELLEERR